MSFFFLHMPGSAQWYDRLSGPYQPVHVPPVSFENSPRIESLLRAGNLYLSLDDAIALALENNLDVELQRFSPAIARSDTERTRGGAATIRGVPLTVSQPPPGIGGPASPILNLPATGAIASTSVASSLPELAAIVPVQISTISIAPAPSAPGPPVPLFDPTITGNLLWEHQTTPEANAFVTGTSSLIGRSLNGTLGLQKGFSSGTELATTFSTNSLNTNSQRNTYNPYNSSTLGLTLTQPLLRGFGPGVNRRYIRIARNNERVSDLVFRQQAIETVSGVIRLYFDLVSLQEDVRVKQQTVALAERLYSDNKDKVEHGTLAPIELIRAQAQVAAARQDLANSQGFEKQQELILKTVLTRRGTRDAVIRSSNVVTTTPIDVPARDDLQPVQDLVDEAYRNRPEVEGARLQITNSHISLEGSRNALLPDISLIGVLQNSGLAGQVNPGTIGSGDPSGFLGGADPAFTGGIGSALSQIFRRNYPTYGVGIQLNLPLKNRIAQGDYTRDEINLRQTEVRLQQLENQVRLEVEGALIALERARASYEAATEARKLQEQSLQIEIEKYENALSTNFLVLQYQSYLAQARSTEVAARGVYAKARNALERATGATLGNHNVSIDDVYRGRIK